jgi:hypothetical protein
MPTPTSNLYATIRTDVHDRLRELARLSNLPVARVVESIASMALGVEHPHSPAVRLAIQTWKRGAPRREHD